MGEKLYAFKNHPHKVFGESDKWFFDLIMPIALMKPFCREDFGENSIKPTEMRENITLTRAAETIGSGKPLRDSRGRFICGAPNPLSGRRAISPELRRAMDRGSVAAISFLESVMNNEKTAPHLRLTAARALIGIKPPHSGKYSKERKNNDE